MQRSQPPDNSWRSVLHDALHARATPVLVFHNQTIPAASVWTGSRCWVRALRDAGISKGDRVALCLDESPGFLFALVACLFEGLGVALATPKDEPDRITQEVDAVAAIAPHPQSALPVGTDGLPAGNARPVRRSVHPPCHDVSVLLRTSGTTSQPRWVALSEHNIISVLRSHRNAIDRRGASVLSVLPWTHSFGLVIDLLSGLLGGADTIVREHSRGRDIDQIINSAEHWKSDSMCMVPLQAERLAARPEGRALLKRLDSGVIGGAPVGAELATTLRATRLRVGYGLTEASPGVCIGEPGQWHAHTIGSPIGCECKVTTRGTLAFRGPNACIGIWTHNGLERFPQGRWHDTGDLVQQDNARYTFLGRIDHNFKLANGRLVQAARIEDAIRRTHGAVECASVVSDDGDALDITVFTSAELHPEESSRVQHLARRATGSLAARVRSVQIVPWARAARTAKGCVVRPAARSNTPPAFSHTESIAA